MERADRGFTGPTLAVRFRGVDRSFPPQASPITIGRGADCTLPIDFALVSRHHAALVWRGAWFLEDHGSANGVFLEGHRLAEPLQIDRTLMIRLGDPDAGPAIELQPVPAPRRPGPPPAAQRSPRPPDSVPAEPGRHAEPGRSDAARSEPGRHSEPARPPEPGRAPTVATPPPRPPQHASPPSGGTPRVPPQAPPRRPQPPARRPGPVQQAQVGTAFYPRGGGKAVRQELPRAASAEALAPASTMPVGGQTIGRTPENSLVINDMLVSRQHARLRPVPDGLLIEDLNSVNGTFVNGVRVIRTLLHEGDIVTFGNHDFVATEGTLRPREREMADNGLALEAVGFSVDGGAKELLVGVTMNAGTGTLTALIGPSGAGKSTLAKLIAGASTPTIGIVRFEGRDVHADFEALSSRIGMVPQDDVLHRQLTVREALTYAAELRLPPDTSKADRAKVVDGVVAELKLTGALDTKVEKLSGGQRKRASVALELLTSPSLLILDEPTSGLDPALDRQVMTMLRELADGGRVVIVVTHSLTYISMCDQALLLARGGKTAFCGRPATIGDTLGSTDWAEIFDRLTDTPDEMHAEYVQRNPRQPAAERPEPHEQSKPPKRTSYPRQVSTISRRQLKLIVADRAYLAFLVLMPLVLGALALVVPGTNGFAIPTPATEEKTEAQQILVLLIIGACFTGTALSIRDLVFERSIYHRERAVGLRPAAYVSAKIIVFSLAAIFQSALMTGTTLAGKGFIDRPGAAFPRADVELFFDISMTACCCVMLGLALSALARSADQVMPLLVVTVMGQLVMSGGLIRITDRPVLSQVSWLFPSRWGYAGAGSSVRLNTLITETILKGVNDEPIVEPKTDPLWAQELNVWGTSIGMLAALGTVFALIAYWRLRSAKR